MQGEIESALAGIKIIVETIAPWKPTATPKAPARFEVARLPLNSRNRVGKCSDFAITVVLDHARLRHVQNAFWWFGRPCRQIRQAVSMSE